jgi:hypothetical protein
MENASLTMLVTDFCTYSYSVEKNELLSITTASKGLTFPVWTRSFRFPTEWLVLTGTTR